jgi:hypothetical protein
VSEIYDTFEHRTQWWNPLGGKGRKWMGDRHPQLGFLNLNGGSGLGGRLASHGWVCNMTSCARRRGPGKRRKCGSRRRGHRDRGSSLHYSYRSVQSTDSVSIPGDTPVASPHLSGPWTRTPHDLGQYGACRGATASSWAIYGSELDLGCA